MTTIYKIFKEGRTADVWVCTLCPKVEIHINPEKYQALNAGKRRRALEIQADKHIGQEHPDKA